MLELHMLEPPFEESRLSRSSPVGVSLFGVEEDLCQDKEDPPVVAVRGDAVCVNHDAGPSRSTPTPTPGGA
eukprot:612325-Prorocentrum_minimum.AAC.1